MSRPKKTFRRQGIPTEYRGILMRSRLEAKWARFFDLLGWRWEYEALDFDGYIPDFVLLGQTNVLVEVRPVDFGAISDCGFPASDAEMARLSGNDLFLDAARKLAAAEFQGDRLICGMSPRPWGPGFLHETVHDAGWGSGLDMALGVKRKS